MNLSRASALGVFATTHIAEHSQRPTISGREIAEALGVPADYLSKILQHLVKARILDSMRGRTGGFSLAGRPESITILAIVEAVEGPVDGRCAAEGIQARPRAMLGVETAYTVAASHLRRVLEGTTVRDLMDCEHPPLLRISSAGGS